MYTLQQHKYPSASMYGLIESVVRKGSDLMFLVKVQPRALVAVDVLRIGDPAKGLDKTENKQLKISTSIQS